MIITYTAKNEIASGHTAGNIYQLTVGAARFEHSMESDSQTTTSLDKKNRETISYGYQIPISIETTGIAPADLDNWREWAASVIGGEEFSIDASGAVNAPAGSFLCYLWGNITGPSQMGSAKYWRYSFKVVQT